MKILVTGSNGCIGTRLSETLVAAGHDVVGVDRREAAWNPEVGRRTLHVDLCDLERVLAAVPDDVDTVVHLAANARVHELVVDPSRAHENQVATFHALELARRRGIRRFLFSSSREVYGNRSEFVNTEAAVDVRDSASTYAAAKIGDEAMVAAYSRCYGIDHVTLRLSNVYGMYDRSTRVVPEFCRAARDGRELVVFGRDKLLDFTYIDDAVAGIVRALDRFDAVRNQTLNLAFGEGTRLVDVAELIRGLMGSTSPVVVRDNRVGEVEKHVADISKLRRELDYSPPTPISVGIPRAVEWYRSHPEALES